MQKDVAEQIGTHVQTVCNWEMGKTSPALPWLPSIIGFLGYDPRLVPDDIGQRLRHHRQGKGVSQKELAGELCVDPGTLARWERGLRKPNREHLKRVQGELEASDSDREY